MSRLEDLAERYGRHLATPWQRTVAGAQRVVMVVYDKTWERALRARHVIFETATRQSGHDWHEIDIAPAFAEWLAGDDEYRDSYFAEPELLQIKLEAEFPKYVADRLRAVLTDPGVTETSVVAVFGVGALLGFARVSQIVKLVEADVRGRLVIFYPGHCDNNTYRLLDARDGWNYLAVPITANVEE
ncbi:DUF1788 domain-containing protein [bacterium]|nr:DUF1788 domain-containing protein [bacterium]